MITETERETERKRKGRLAFVVYRGLPMQSPKLKPHGAREMERRKNQIAKGQLRFENGLAI